MIKECTAENIHYKEGVGPYREGAYKLHRGCQVSLSLTKSHSLTVSLGCFIIIFISIAIPMISESDCTIFLCMSEVNTIVPL